jgi:non-ribosomal peptide synthetase component F
VSNRISTSPYEPIAVGDVPFHDLVADVAARRPDRPALIDGATGAALSYGALSARVDRVAATLARRGFRPGDVLALDAPNSPPWAVAALGAMAAGVAVTGVSPAATPGRGRAPGRRVPRRAAGLRYRRRRGARRGAGAGPAHERAA